MNIPTDLRFINKIGRNFGLLLVETYEGKDKYRKSLWGCLCKCGNRTVVKDNNLGRNTNSCGCMKSEWIAVTTRVKLKTHGLTKTKEYRAWRGAKTRCYNPNSECWKYYGNRGIRVCNRWLNSFENFLEDMGKCPHPKLSLERKKVNGNYSPKNCIWATSKEQGNNKTNNVIIEFFGHKKTFQQWLDLCGVSRNKINYWVGQGKSYHEAFCFSAPHFFQQLGTDSNCLAMSSVTPTH